MSSRVQTQPSCPPCVLHEDNHLLVVNKPAGLNTHAPDPFAGEGLYDWLRRREPRWANLAIVHRLDKETSGIIVFGKTTAANRSLTDQFTRRTVEKKYLLLTDRPVNESDFLVKSRIVRAGDRYVSGNRGEPAETRFHRLESKFSVPAGQSAGLFEAEPLTGRTHQIRVHAAAKGMPVLGDTLYGGSAFPRVCLHAAGLAFRHPATGRRTAFRVPVDFAADTRLALRAALITPEETDAFRIVHGASDGWPEWHVDKLGDFLLSQSDAVLTERQRTELARLCRALAVRGACHKIVNRRPDRSRAPTPPELFWGEAAPERFVIRENGIQFELSFNDGCSTGLFLDQRDNRRRLLTGHVAAGFPVFDSGAAGSIAAGARGFHVLNAFAYTCGFSVCAAMAGATVTSLDLSKHYLDWGRRNFASNGLDPGKHDFIFGDAFEWMRRLVKKGRRFDLILLDPPTFSRSKQHGVFRAGKDYGDLVSAALPLLRPGGVLFASTNATGLAPETVLAAVTDAVRTAGRKIVQEEYVPQPPDFPVSRDEPAYLKTLWLRLS